ncbi:pyridoxamine 5'-phosphate oxidase family protein [Mycobacterium simiae]|uniref:pyridoxamine 5'-phosphate oxidase family protein n=1 Tax=Mycobacterium simiae TaxID=1784 RepID=UPI0020CB563D|nr:pyridoxamine 5'-phosphate oxidase family protein [Mycobacterium simiae]
MAERQKAAGSIHSYGRFHRQGNDIGQPDRLDSRIASLITGADSFFIATVTPTGWPYLQHRGGPSGFVQVLDPATIGFAEYSGNQQYITIGNLDADDKVALFFIDYPTRTRVKVYGRARVIEHCDDPQLLKRLLNTGHSEVRTACPRAIVIAVEAFDINCRRNIPVKYGADSVNERVRLARHDLLEENADLRTRIAKLEQQLAGDDTG